MAQDLNRTTMLSGIGMGVTLGAISASIGVIGPIIERWADGLQARRLGVFGTFLIFCVFVLESIEHWLVLFDVPIRYPGAAERRRTEAFGTA